MNIKFEDAAAALAKYKKLLKKYKPELTETDKPPVFFSKSHEIGKDKITAEYAISGEIIDVSFSGKITDERTEKKIHSLLDEARDTDKKAVKLKRLFFLEGDDE